MKLIIKLTIATIILLLSVRSQDIGIINKPKIIKKNQELNLAENEYQIGNGILRNNSLFLAYYRNSYLVEITGNEASFGAALKIDFDYSKSYKNKNYIFISDFYILESLSLRGRFYENFNPPFLYPNNISVNLPLFNFGKFNSIIKLGIMETVFDVMPMKSYFLPIVFSISKSTESSDIGKSYINHALVMGHRDHPITYLITPHYDTGLLLELRIALFEILLGFSNGELGLDSNSAKSIIGRFSYKSKSLFTGWAFQIGNLASVPIKENQHFGKYFIYYNFKYFTFGFEGMLILHGLRDLATLERDVKNEFHYIDGFFSPFTVYNDGSYNSSSQFDPNMLYGIASGLFVKIKIYNFSSIIHGSVYDPNLLSEKSSMYKRKYRGFIRLEYWLTPFLNTVFSYTYTYDHYFLNNSQFYDATEPRDNHPIIDHDFYLGMVFSLY